MKYRKQNRLLAIMKSLSNSKRIAILKAIYKSKGSLSVNEICKNIDLAQGRVSDHLRILKLNKIVKPKQEGNEIYYSICEPIAEDLISRV